MKDVKFFDGGYGRGTISVSKLNSPVIYSEMLKTIRYIEKHKGIGVLTIDFDKVYDKSYPNCLVPVSGLLDYFKKNENIHIKVRKLRNSYLNRTQFVNSPVITKSQISSNNSSVFDKVWKFSNPKETKLISDYVFNEILNNISCQAGVLNAISWCINEVMDNVLRHSKVNFGFFMCQHHVHTNRLAFAIYDYGIGFYNSLYSSYRPRNYEQAIQLAITEKVTSDKVDGRGFGLYGLHQIIKLNQGTLNISSMSSTYIYRNEGRIRDQYFSNSNYISPQAGTVLIDFQIDYTNKTDIMRVLPGGPYEQFEMLLESLEDQNGAIQYKLSDYAESTGNRKSGLPIRNQLINIYNERSSWILIDFEGIKYIASSFADEVFGKLIVQVGEKNFGNRFRLKNLSNELRGIISFSLNDRINKKS